jgi:hypothetical protein
MRSIVAVGTVPFLVLAAYAFAAGCGSSSSSCESSCNAARSEQACSDGVKDCAAFCAAWQQIADASGCSAEYTAQNDCFAAQPDVCAAEMDDNGACGYAEGTPGRAFETCVAPYCQKHDAQCNAADSL